MAKPRGPGSSDDARSRGSRAAPSGARSVTEAQETIGQDARAGRPGGRAGSWVTRPTGTAGGRPEGAPTRIRPEEDADVRRSLERENSGAAILAGNGHRVTQNPSADEVARARQASGDSGRPGARPDYLIEGRVFDCYAPSRNKGVRGIWSEVEAKIRDEQTQRVVVNLEDWGGNLTDLRGQFTGWPMERLKEVKVITSDGDVVQIVPDPANG